MLAARALPRQDQPRWRAKRQEPSAVPSASAAPSSDAPPASSAAPPASSAAPAPSSAAPEPSSAAPPPSSAAPSSAAPPPSSAAPPPSSSTTTTTITSAAPPSSAAPSSAQPTSSPGPTTTTTTITPSSSNAAQSSAQQPTTSTLVVTPSTSNDPQTSTVIVTPSASSSASEITASSRLVLTSTGANGAVVTETPSSFTSEIVTESNGSIITKTVVVHNPTGALDNSSGDGSGSSSFFDNTGAVAGTFVVVGLVVVGVLFALGLLCFRRRRRQRLDREVTAAAVAASAQHQRSPLDEGDDVHSGSGPTTSESYPSTVNHPMAQYSQYGASYANAGGYDPYAQHPYPEQPYTDHPGQGPFDTPHGYDPYAHTGAAAGAAGAGGYESLQHGQQGYYFDPRDAAQYADQEPHTGRYDDASANYSGGEGSLDTPLERENPLHVANPSRQR